MAYLPACGDHIIILSPSRLLESVINNLNRWENIVLALLFHMPSDSKHTNLQKNIIDTLQNDTEGQLWVTTIHTICIAVDLNLQEI